VTHPTHASHNFLAIRKPHFAIHCRVQFSTGASENRVPPRVSTVGVKRVFNALADLQPATLAMCGVSRYRSSARFRPHLGTSTCQSIPKAVSSSRVPRTVAKLTRSVTFLVDSGVAVRISHYLRIFPGLYETPRRNIAFVNDATIRSRIVGSICLTTNVVLNGVLYAPSFRRKRNDVLS
jgi:hypothetical protein